MGIKKIESATLAGGCFWCLEAVFQEVKGINNVVSGYSGGHIPNPSYEAVCAETTGHAEAVQITFDPSIITYKEILTIFFSIHDPTSINRQGYDIGTRYRSAIFYHNTIQKTTAEETITNITHSKIFESPIVTKISPLDKFYQAEDYHQKFYQNNYYQPYCQAIISPKLAKLRAEHMDKLDTSAHAKN